MTLANAVCKLNIYSVGLRLEMPHARCQARPSHTHYCTWGSPARRWTAAAETPARTILPANDPTDRGLCIYVQLPCYWVSCGGHSCPSAGACDSTAGVQALPGLLWSLGLGTIPLSPCGGENLFFFFSSLSWSQALSQDFVGGLVALLIAILYVFIVQWAGSTSHGLGLCYT